MKDQNKLSLFVIVFSSLYLANIIFISHENICILADNSTSDPSDIDSLYRYSCKFNFNISVEQNLSMITYTLGNEAIVQTYCHLFSNSTSNITLFIEGEGWNVTTISVDIGQKANMTATNGIVNPEGGDVIGIKFKLRLFRGNQTGNANGLLTVVASNLGWYPAPWVVFPSVLALVIIWIGRKHNKRN